MRAERRRGPSARALFVVTCVFIIALSYKGEYDSCVRNQAIRAAYNDSFDVQRRFLTTARDRNLQLSALSTGELRAILERKAQPPAGLNADKSAALEAALVYQRLIDGQRSVRELDCGAPFPDNS